MDMALLAGLSARTAVHGLFCSLPLPKQRLALKHLAICSPGWPLLPSFLLDMVLPSPNVGCKGLLEVSGPIPLLKAGLPPKPNHVVKICKAGDATVCLGPCVSAGAPSLPRYARILINSYKTLLSTSFQGMSSVALGCLIQLMCIIQSLERQLSCECKSSCFLHTCRSQSSL